MKHVSGTDVNADVLIGFVLMTMFSIKVVTSYLSLCFNAHPRVAETDSGPLVPLAYFTLLAPKNTDT